MIRLTFAQVQSGVGVREDTVLLLQTELLKAVITAVYQELVEDADPQHPVGEGAGLSAEGLRHQAWSGSF
jgi:hypothetical protein